MPRVVATGVLRPLQLAWDGSALVVLSAGARGEAAAELHRVAVDRDSAVDLSVQTPRKIPFDAALGTTLGSLAIEPASGALFMGEENGARVWRLGADGRPALYASGLRRLAGGGTIAFDGTGRLLLLDHADPFVAPPERLPPALEQLRDEDYRGPLIYRLVLDPTLALPRRVDNLPPFFPRRWSGRASIPPLPDFLSIVTGAGGELVVLAATGALYRVSEQGALTSIARLPRAQYARTNMAAAADGSIYVSGGFHVGQVFHVTADGRVETIASNLADPAGIALDAGGAVYVAESSRHRILRVR